MFLESANITRPRDMCGKTISYPGSPGPGGPAIVQTMVESAGWRLERWDSAAALRRLLELGARWDDASAKEIGAVRRGLLRTEDYTFRSLVLTLATGDACSPDVRRELGRTGAFRRRLQAVRLMPKPGDRW